VPAVLFTLFVLQALVSLVLAPYGAAETNDLRDQLLFFSFGMFVSQPLVLAIVAGLWPARWPVAVVAGLVLVGLLAHFANFASVQHHDQGYGESSLLIIWAEAYLFLLLPLTILRWPCGWRMQMPQAPTRGRGTHQFRLRGLMGAVTAVGVVLAIFRITAVPMHFSERVKPAATVVAETLLTGSVIAVCLLGLLPLVGLVLATSKRRWYAIGSLVGIAASVSFLAWLTTPGTIREDLDLAIICSGVVVSVLLSLWSLRWCGFRLVRERL
jgi:hypothetical protein